MKPWLLLEGGRVIDGTGAAPFAGSVLIKGKKIVATGDSETLLVQLPEGAHVERVDATGSTIMPGIIDAHCHMSFGEARNDREMYSTSTVEYRTIVASLNLQKVLRAGVTSISEPGGSYFISPALRDAVKAGLLKGPRIFAGGRFIGPSPASPLFMEDLDRFSAGHEMVLANTLDEMVSEIRRQAHRGVDLIKLADSPMGQRQCFTDREMCEIAELAHNMNLRVTIHARGNEEVRAAVKAGFDWILHANTMTDDVIEDLARANIPIVPTLTLSANFADFGHLYGSPVAARTGRLRMLEHMGETIKRARAAGVTVIGGTDSGVSPGPFGEWHAREMELMVRFAGMTTLEAIRSMTKDAAVTVGLEGKLGEIAPDMIADIIVVKGDPTQNLRILLDKANITHVIKDGEIVTFDEEALAKSYSHKRTFNFSDGEMRVPDIYGSIAHDTPAPDLFDPEKDFVSELVAKAGTT